MCMIESKTPMHTCCPLRGDTLQSTFAIKNVAASAHNMHFNAAVFLFVYIFVCLYDIVYSSDDEDGSLVGGGAVVVVGGGAVVVVGGSVEGSVSFVVFEVFDFLNVVFEYVPSI